METKTVSLVFCIKMNDTDVADLTTTDHRHPFLCVQEFIYSRIDAVGGIEPRKGGQVFLSLRNLEYLFYEFLKRFNAETGADVQPENQSLNLYAELIFEAYFGLLDSFDVYASPVANDVIVQNIAAWNKLTLQSLLLRTIGPYQRQRNYLRRVRDPKYGMRRITPVRLVSKKTKRIEENLMQNYAGIGTTFGKLLYPVNDSC